MEKVKESPFQFGNINIIAIDFKCKNMLDKGDHEISIKREVKLFEIDNDIENNKFENKVVLTLEISTENKEALVSASIQGDFKIEGVDNARAKILFQQNAPALLLSYLRPILSVILQKSYFPVDIPFLDFTEPIEKND